MQQKKKIYKFLVQEMLIFSVSILYFSWGTGNTSLWDIDEPIYAQSLKEMMANHNLILPTYNGQILPDKPILNYWMMWAGIKLFGLDSFGLRIGSAIVGALLVLLIVSVVRRMYSEKIAFLSALIIATILHSTVIFRSATPDPLLILATTAALLSFLLAYLDPQVRRNALFSFYLALALGTLDKGPIAFLLPGLIVVIFLIVQQNLHFLWQQGKLGLGLPLFLILLMPWYVAVGLETHWMWDKLFLLQQNIGRFDASMQGHRGPWFYYVLSVFLGMLPWSVFLPQALLWLKRTRALTQDKQQVKNQFMLLWAAVWIIFFSLSATKLPSYVWESYPPLAILLATHLDSRLQATQKGLTKSDALSLGVLFAIGVLLTTFGGWIVPMRQPEIPRMLWLGTPYIVAALVAGVWIWRQRVLWALLSLAGGAVALSVLVVFLYTPEFNRLKPSREMAEKIFQIQAGAPYRLASWQWFQPDFLFYAARGAMTIHHLQDTTNIRNYMGNRPLYVVCPATDLSKLISQVESPYQAKIVLIRYEIYNREKIALLRVAKP
ncbi:MAG: glycosyltransferase family 39 protein [Acidithiobacillus sp.]|nr:glycosyltransferase family 39 protein [Acidithiobacillus sp.]